MLPSSGYKAKTIGIGGLPHSKAQISCCNPALQVLVDWLGDLLAVRIWMEQISKDNLKEFVLESSPTH